MRHFALLLLPLLFLACKKEPDPDEAAVHVQVGYPHESLGRGCIVVAMTDGAGNVLEEKGLDFREPPQTPGTMSFAVFRKAGWSRDVQITVALRELDCSAPNKTVASRTRSFSFKSAGRQEWQVEPFEGKDDDKDGYIAVAFGGSDCDDGNPEVSPAAFEQCNDRDDNCNGQVDEELLTREWFVDRDGDGVGSGPATVKCNAPSAQHVDRGGDCDDGDASVHPFAVESCNDKDDNCDGNVDEPFETKGDSCRLQCAGTLKCNAEGTGVACDAPAPVAFYADEDEDGEGAAGSSILQMACADEPPAKMASNTRDCDDHDAQTHTGAQEVCDGLDNNCNAAVDEQLSCGGTLKRVTDAAFANHDWRTVALGRDGYPVWVAGAGGALAVKRAVGESFRDSASIAMGTCTAMGNVDWNAAWVNPSTGHVYLAGTGGWLAEFSADTCLRNKKVDFVDTTLPAHARTSVNDYFTGIVGFESPFSLFAVSSEGWLYEWKEDPQAPALHVSTNYGYRGVHALVFDRIYAAGRTASWEPHAPLINLHATPDRSVRNLQSLGGVAGYVGNLRAVWAATASTIYSVGDGGLVMRGTGQSPNWERVLPPIGPVPDFSSVVAPTGSDVAYVVDRGVAEVRDSGLLHRLTRHGWARPPEFTTGAPDRRLRDIAMNSAGNFWIVGDEGRVYHFPEP
ncbi:putative metal-binding motif-containing protein [Comamonas sp. JC664]|uniref:putative metal-binding motif-containing protein n=1 Tax=Comamonas sp. JC664 TaxID=2801917 RepID=UPI00191D07F4|nr:putative metal-binding motif-containing protein [Comamonas sp. JC664]MBL0698258.1 putative metal-binding motif-containing protein [Comamonas sp. JC664]GHG89223.1 hypothetical protein GCM10012319_48460 [Comamonas sp. KCTC 72670]